MIKNVVEWREGSLQLIWVKVKCGSETWALPVLMDQPVKNGGRENFFEWFGKEINQEKSSSSGNGR